MLDEQAAAKSQILFYPVLCFQVLSVSGNVPAALQILTTRAKFV